jgi:glycerophosphoryl diester phosphodiesterase
MSTQSKSRHSSFRHSSFRHSSFRHSSFRRFSAVAAAVVLSTLVGACGGDDDATTTTGATDTVANTEVATTVPTTDAAAPETEAPMAIDQVVAPEATTVDALLALDRPIIIAHAGGDFDWPHSTMYAFTQAVLNGTDVLEMDVMLSSDGVLMVQHDNTVDRLTNNTGLVSSFTAAELQAMDNAYWFSGGVWVDKELADDAYIYRGVRTGDQPAPEGFTADDFRMVTFEEVSRAFPNHVLDVELKIPESAAGEVDLESAKAAAKELARLIKETGREKSIVVVSFSDEIMTEFRNAIPEVATSPGQDSLVNWYLAGGALDPRDVIMQAPPVYEGVEVLTQETFDRAHAENRDVWVWMNDSAQETTEFYSKLVTLGADGLLISSPTKAP